MSIPQSSAGSILHYLSKILSQPENIKTIYQTEKTKRDFETFDHTEFERLIKAANHQHGNPKLKPYVERAPVVNASIMSIHNKMFTLKGLAFRNELQRFEKRNNYLERMYWRLVEIYRFPVTSLTSVLDSLVRSIDPNAAYEIRALKGENKLDALSQIVNHKSIRPEIDFVSQVVNEYLASETFRKKRVPEFRKMPAQLRAQKKESPSREEIIDLQKDGFIASSIAFDLYPKLRNRYEPERAFQISMALLGYEYTRSHEIFTATLMHRKSTHGLEDALLKEILSTQSIKEYGIVGDSFFD